MRHLAFVALLCLLLSGFGPASHALAKTIEISPPQGGGEQIIEKSWEYDVWKIPSTNTCAFAKDGDDLVIQREDGGKTVLRDFYTGVTREMLEDITFETADGHSISAATFLTALDENLMVVAGPFAPMRDIGEGYSGKDVTLGDFCCLHSLRKAAEAGNAEAQFLMGERLFPWEQQNVSEKNHAMQWLKKAAKQGHLYARARLALLLGQRDPQWEKTFSGLVNQLKQKIDAKGWSEFFLGEFQKIEHWSGAPKGDWFDKALAKGNPSAVFAMEAEKYTEGFGESLFDVMAEQGNPRAQYLLTERAAIIGEEDFKIGLDLCARAAAQDYAPAQRCKGQIFLGKKEDALAIPYFEKAAEQEDPLAIAYLALCYREGRGVTKDENKAAMLRKRAESLAHGDESTSGAIRDLLDK